MLPDLGIRLQLLIGPTVPAPAPFTVVDALTELEVTNKDREIDGFQMTFTLGRTSSNNYGLLADGTLDPPNRVILMIFMGAMPQVLIDGIITQHQVVPSNRPGESKLIVTGEDITRQLDRDDRKATYPKQGDSDIVRTILGNYATYGLAPKITATSHKPTESERVPTQQTTDLKFIRALAQRNGFVFYIEPTAVPGVNTAYWGKDNRQGQAQTALTLNMGPATNVDSPVSITFDAFGPAAPEVGILDPDSKLEIKIPIPTGFEPALSNKLASPLRKTQSWDTANLTPLEAALRALTGSTESSDAVSLSGEVDAVRYGRILRSRRLVDLRGVGQSYDGTYYVKEVKHQIKRGQYRQSFSLTREGRGSLTSTVNGG
jgi:hypothetical protein